MKTLKIKLGLLGLLAILAVSVFLTSCEQEEINMNTLDEVLEEGLTLDLPNDFSFESEEALFTYLNNLDIDQFGSTESVSNGEISSRSSCGSYVQISTCKLRKYCTYYGLPFYFYWNWCNGTGHIVWL